MSRLGAALASLEEGNNRELDELYNKVAQMKEIASGISGDLDDDRRVREVVGAKIDTSQRSLLSTLENLSSSFAQTNRGNALKAVGAFLVAGILLYLVLTVRM